MALDDFTITGIYARKVKKMESFAMAEKFFARYLMIIVKSDAISPWIIWYKNIR